MELIATSSIRKDFPNPWFFYDRFLSNVFNLQDFWIPRLTEDFLPRYLHFYTFRVLRRQFGVNILTISGAVLLPGLVMTTVNYLIDFLITFWEGFIDFVWDQLPI